MTSSQAVFGLFGAIYVWGWISTYWGTSAFQEPKLWKRWLGFVILFFVWWWIAFAMMNPRH